MIPAVGLFLCLLLSLCGAFEDALSNSDLRAPAADVRLRQLLSLHTVQLGYRLAFLGLAQSCLLRGRELPIFQRFEITVLRDALGLAAIDDAVGFPRIVRLAFDECDGPADQAFTACAECFERLLLTLIDALDLVSMSGDGRVLVFPEAVHLVVVQSTHVVRLPAMFVLLLRFLTLLALGDGGLRAPPYIRRERASLVLLCGGIGFVPVVRLAAELTPGTFLFDGFLRILCATISFFAEGDLPLFRALAFFTSATFGNALLFSLR